MSGCVVESCDTLLEKEVWKTRRFGFSGLEAVYLLPGDDDSQPLAVF